MLTMLCMMRYHMMYVGNIYTSTEEWVALHLSVSSETFTAVVSIIVLTYLLTHTITT